MTEFWTWVRAEQQARGLSHEECARAAGMTKSGWSHYINEPSADPRRSTLRRVAKGLGMSLEEVLQKAGKRPVGMSTGDEKMRLGENLRNARMLSGWTQEMVADTLGIGRTTYTQYETGVLEPSGLVLKKLADLFRVKVDDLFTSGETVFTASPLNLQTLGCELVERLERIEELLLSSRQDRTPASR